VGDWIKVKVPRQSYYFPQCCADCLCTGSLTALVLSSDERKLKSFHLVSARYEYLTVEVPYCEQCAARQLKWGKMGQRLMLLAIIVSVCVGLWFDIGSRETGLLTVVLAAPAIWLMLYRDWTVRVKAYDRDTVTFSFKRSEYAQEFVRMNEVEANAALTE